MQNQLAMEVGRLFIFSIFVTAVLEVIKAGALRFQGVPLKEETAKLFNFILGLLFCYTFSYGVMTRIFYAGDAPKGSLANWIDYIATASVVFMGAEWFFHKFSAIIAKNRAIKAAAEDAPTMRESTRSTSRETERIITKEPGT